MAENDVVLVISGRDETCVGRMCMGLLADLINQGFERENIDNAPRIVIEEESPISEKEQAICTSIGGQFQKIHHVLQQDTELQSAITQLNTTGQGTHLVSTVLTVARVIWGDVGKIGWGRIATVFCFASEMCVKAVKNGIGRGDELKQWIEEFIVKFTVFFKEQFGQWIVVHGGWRAILVYYSSPIAYASVLAISAVAGIYAVYKLGQK